MTVEVLAGDSAQILPRLEAESFDAGVMDPPYHLTSIVQRFGKAGSAPPSSKGATGVYKRAARGFMGQQWDGGDIAFRPAFWAEVLRVLKPGAHLVAFGGSRTYHRMACAVEDAGFEIRDQIMWLYGTGFPKSHDVSKAIDKRVDWGALKRLQDLIKDARRSLGISQSEAARRCGLIAPGETLGGGGFMWFETGKRVPNKEQYLALKAALSLGNDCDAAFEHAERAVVGRHAENSSPGVFGDHRFSFVSRDITASCREESRAWEGWGTALKPAHEPIVLARKPLKGTVAQNVLKNGTGAINVDDCRIDVPDLDRRDECDSANGRWPANVCHDGSEEVVACFPAAPGQRAAVSATAPSPKASTVYGRMTREPETLARQPRECQGSAARFFYCAKAGEDDRLASKHPTVKPVALMRWLVRLVTPPGGRVLDPFAGTGTTGMACLREGFDCLLIEREEQYLADIRRRLEHVAGGDTPLFGGGQAGDV